MPKLFVISDVHGFYDEMKEALDNAGFDPKNQNHWLIGCGDYFDRGIYPARVMNYLQSLQRKVLVKGNHESLFQDCCDRGYWMPHDCSNGTMNTICDLGGEKYGRSFDECCAIARQITAPFINSMVNYFETKNYIFVHSFVPLNVLDGKPMYYTKNRKFAIDEDWRTAHNSDWESARWGNPFDLAKRGFLPEKTLIFGHWSVEDAWAEIENRTSFDEAAHFDPYYGDGYIGIDSTTAYSHMVNVLVLEDEFLN